MAETNTLPNLKPGMHVKVHQRIKDVTPKGEEKERIQIFEGTVIGTRHGKETGATFTVRKVTKGFGVEKIFPIHSPIIAKVEVVKEHKVRRAKLNYLRDPKFNKRMKEKDSVQQVKKTKKKDTPAKPTTEKKEEPQA